MKIGSTGALRSAVSAKKNRAPQRAGKPGFSSRLKESASSDASHDRAVISSADSAETPPIASDSLMILQEAALASVPGASEQKSRTEIETLLGELKSLQIRLLENRLRKSEIEALAVRLSRRQKSTEHPRLGSILDQIETRVRVEIAKYRRRS